MRKRITMIMAMVILVSMLLVGFGGTQVGAETGSLQGYWHLNTGEGSTAYDFSDFGNDGELSGGKFGNALCFDGTDDYVEVADDDSLDITGDLTVEAWIVADDISTYKSIIVKGDAYTEGKINYALQIHSEYQKPGTLRFFKWGGSYSWVDSTSQVPADGNWHHVAVTHDSSNNVKIFLDGTLCGSGTLVLGPISDSPLDIGRHKHATVGIYQYWDGKIDEVRISNSVRYTGNFAPQTSAFTSDGNTALLLHMDESTGFATYDDSSNSNYGTIYGPTWCGPTWTTGPHGSALLFDGIDDKVLIPYQAGLSLTDAFTVEAWFWRDPSNTDSLQYIVSKDISTSGLPFSNYNLLIFNNKPALFLKGLTIGTATQGTAYSDAGGGGIVGETVASKGEWHHIACVYTESELKIYLDGEQDGAVPATGNPHTNSEDVWIGMRKTPSYDQGEFQGKIDEVRIWGYALNPCQIQLAMEGKIDILPYAGMVMYKSAFHNVAEGDIISIGITPDDTSITIDHIEVHHTTPKKKSTTPTVTVEGQCDYSIIISVTGITKGTKTAHCWLYLSNGEHVGINLHFDH